MQLGSMAGLLFITYFLTKGHKMSAEKKHREFWIILGKRSIHDTVYVEKRPDFKLPTEPIHAVEYSALTEAQDEIKRLKTNLDLAANRMFESARTIGNLKREINELKGKV